jgi:hypothetical protein
MEFLRILHALQAHVEKLILCHLLPEPSVRCAKQVGLEVQRRLIDMGVHSDNSRTYERILRVARSLTIMTALWRVYFVSNAPYIGVAFDPEPAQLMMISSALCDDESVAAASVALCQTGLVDGGLLSAIRLLKANAYAIVTTGAGMWVSHERKVDGTTSMIRVDCSPDDFSKRVFNWQTEASNDNMPVETLRAVLESMTLMSISADAINGESERIGVSFREPYLIYTKEGGNPVVFINWAAVSTTSLGSSDEHPVTGLLKAILNSLGTAGTVLPIGVEGVHGDYPPGTLCTTRVGADRAGYEDEGMSQLAANAHVSELGLCGVRVVNPSNGRSVDEDLEEDVDFMVEGMGV